LPFETLDAFAEAVKRSPDAGRTFLRALIARPEVAEALYVASPGLVEGIEKWHKDPLSERGRKVERALISYIERMSTRCTPFGLFASVSVGRVGKATRTQVAALNEVRRRTRLDNGYLQALCEQLTAKPEVRRGLKYVANETLHVVGERLHFVTARQDAGRRVYDLSAVDALEALTAHVLPAAREGLTPSELVAALLKAMPELSAEEAVGFVDQLIDAQILLGSLAVPLTGREGIDAVVDQLHSLEGAQAHVKALEAARAAMTTLDATLSNTSAPYEALGALLTPLEVPFEKGQLVQVDLARLGDGTELPESLIRQVFRLASVLASASPQTDDPLAAFRAAFSNRYEGAEVSLLEALDDEAGVGFTSENSGHAAPLLKDILFEGGTKATLESDSAWDTWVGGLILKASLGGENEIVLDEADLEHRAVRSNPFAESCYLSLTLFDRKPGSTTPVAALTGVGGPSSESLFGRFAWLDERLERAVRDGLAAEERLRPEARFAELVHSPEGRSGNVIARPAVRALEIPILSRGGLPVSQTLRLDDLFLSINSGRLVLRSASFNCEVVPRLTNAHNYMFLGLPLYRFLAILQSEGLPRVGLWSWGAHRNAPALPRVRLGTVVVVPAKWSLNQDLLKPLATATAVREMAKRLRWPRFMVAREHDNTLAIDLENDLSVETFIDSYTHRPSATLEEDLDRVYGSPFSNDQGRYANELMVSLVANERRTPAMRPQPPVKVARLFTPGHDWLYARVHVTPAMAERVLLQTMPELLEWARSTGELKRWFFIRYDDQGHHLRFRFQGAPTWLREQVLPRLETALRPWVDSKIVSRIHVDTYRREVERYGGDEGMLLAESWFEAASDEALALVTAYPRDVDLEARSWATLWGVNRIVSLLLDTDDSKIKALGSWRESLVQENNGGTALETSLSKTARTHRALVAQLVSGAVPESLSAVTQLLHSQAAVLSPLAAQYKALDAQGRLTASLGEISGALMHMHVNRLLRSQQRRQEMVIYDVLLRHLKSQQGRTRAK
jgi:thiopeptide-type bacteriocin biosynthesis protein